HLEHPDVSHSDHNPFCGDEITLELKIEDGVVVEAAFVTYKRISTISVGSNKPHRFAKRFRSALYNMSSPELKACQGLSGAWINQSASIHSKSRTFLPQAPPV
ncbi:MAG: iron-sulfur cluster assembly scaffold protein, partial [Bacteroidales bacterium]